MKLHFPIDYNFEDYAGCYLKVYAMDYNNTNVVSLVSYYFDKQIQDRFNRELQLSSPPYTLNGKLWGKYIEISYPSINTLSLQRTNNIAITNSINSNLTKGTGLSNTAPVMIEFGYITKKTVINNITTFLLRAPYQTSVPQTPDFENLAVKIEPSVDGDWFNIFGTYNSSVGGFNNWINTSKQAGKVYYVEYVITMYEENIKGKSMTVQILEDFNEKVEFRPIVKYSSTTAAIEVVMRVIDRVDDSTIVRRASYGLLPDEVSKYSRSITRINVNGIKTPIIYNLKNPTTNNSVSDAWFNNGEVQTVKVPYSLLVNSNRVVAKSESSIIDDTEWFGFGKLKLVVDPFDNVFKFVIAQSVDDKVEYFDLLQVGDIQLHFKNYEYEVTSNLYRKTGEIDLANGTVVFKLKKENVNKVRRIYQSGINMFYITSNNTETDETTVIYEGTFIMSDSIEYVNELGDEFANFDGVEIDRTSGEEFAIVTRRRTVGSSKLTSTKNSQLLSDIKTASEFIKKGNTSFTVVTNNTLMPNDFFTRKSSNGAFDDIIISRNTTNTNTSTNTNTTTNTNTSDGRGNINTI